MEFLRLILRDNFGCTKPRAVMINTFLGSRCCKTMIEIVGLSLKVVSISS